jgi:hypothetical protein
MRLRADFWVQAFIRRCAAEGRPAVLRRRGAEEAGAILIVVDRLDGTCTLYGPAPQGELAQAQEEAGVERLWMRLHKTETLPVHEAEARLAREIKFDSDVWIVEVEDRQGKVLFDVVEG